MLKMDFNDQEMVRDSMKTLRNPHLLLDKLKRKYEAFQRSSLFSQPDTSSILTGQYRDDNENRVTDDKEYRLSIQLDSPNSSKHFSELFEQCQVELLQWDIKDREKELASIGSSSLPTSPTFKVPNDFKKADSPKSCAPHHNDLLFSGKLNVFEKGAKKRSVWGKIVGNRLTIHESYETRDSITLIAMILDPFVKAIPNPNPLGFTIFVHSRPVLELDVGSVVKCLKWTSFITAVSCNFTISK
jgi:hypothetical protein